MKEFVKLLDISDNVARVKSATDSIKNPVQAACWFVALSPVASVFVWLSWIFDMSSTLDWAKDFMAFAQATTAAVVIGSGAGVVMIWFLTLFPTLSEISMGRLANYGVPFIMSFVYGGMLFDLLTDFEKADAAARQFLYPLIVQMVGNNFWTEVIFFAGRWIFVFMASIVFEVMAVTLIATLIFLAINMGKSQIEDANRGKRGGITEGFTGR